MTSVYMPNMLLRRFTPCWILKFWAQFYYKRIKNFKANVYLFESERKKVIKDTNSFEEIFKLNRFESINNWFNKSLRITSENTFMPEKRLYVNGKCQIIPSNMKKVFFASVLPWAKKSPCAELPHSPCWIVSDSVA